MYKMPEARANADETESLLEQNPVVGIQPKIQKELESLNFRDAKILAFFTIKTETSINYIMIANGHHLGSSIIILNSDMKVKLASEFKDIKIS